MNSTISFVVGGEIVAIDLATHPDLAPTTTVLSYLRNHANRRSVKEGCAVGDCGACTVVLGEIGPDRRITYKAVNSCLLLLPMIDGKQLLTAEDLRGADGRLHAVQEAMVEAYGSQCGFCTPGIVMSMFAIYRNSPNPTREEVRRSLTGNLCRCTGYRPIVDAALRACFGSRNDGIGSREAAAFALLQSLPKESFAVGNAGRTYVRPMTLEEALAWRNRLPEALVISGATDAALRLDHDHPADIIDLSGVESLRKITQSDTALTIGAGVPLSEILSGVEHLFPSLHRMLSVFGSGQIRNLATVGGSLGTASPIGDLLPVLIAHKARVVLESTGNRREVDIDRFVTGYRTSVLGERELITSVVLPKPSPGALIRSYKISKRKDVDISTLCGGFRLELGGDARVKSVVLAYGGMSEKTARAGNVERFLGGKPWTRETVEEAVTRLGEDFVPISDTRGSARFRMTAARNLLLKFWNDTQSHAG